MLNSKKMSFQPLFFNWNLFNEKKTFADNSRFEPTIDRKNIIIFETFLWSFFGGNLSLGLSEVLSYLTYFCHEIEGECHHVACLCGN